MPDPNHLRTPQASLVREKAKVFARFVPGMEAIITIGLWLTSRKTKTSGMEKIADALPREYFFCFAVALCVVVSVHSSAHSHGRACLLVHGSAGAIRGLWAAASRRGWDAGSWLQSYAGEPRLRPASLQRSCCLHPARRRSRRRTSPQL